ncbi:MAG: hypothetical protein V2A76_12295 [Planctomycetota bacterium]
MTGAVAAAALFCLSQEVQAKSSILSAWNALYPNSQSETNAAGAGSSCLLCHQSMSAPNYNAYGWNIYLGINSGGLSYTAAILAAEPANSDSDPTASSNLVEVNADTQPGYTAGPNNTWYWNTGSTVSNQSPPSGILGNLDPVPNPWTDLGYGLAGTGGATPLLAGTGTLVGGTPAGLSLSNALPGSSTWLFIGLTQVNTPLRGGTLVPSADFLVPNLPVNGSGALAIGTTWPPVPSGTAVYFQYWVIDAGAPSGVSASNGLEAMTQ